MLWRNKKECLSGSEWIYSSCDNDYFPLFDKLNECHKNESRPDGY